MAKEKNIKLFNKDVKENEGYYYTKTSKLSCRFANQRLTQAVVEATDLSGKKIIDIGCGDGTYTFELLVKNPDYILGIDAAEVAISTASKKASEMDNIEFVISTNPGEPFKRLRKIASGGELSRVMLAIKSILAESDNINVLIFDEVDAGIGGEVAVAVGSKLKKLSEIKQIFCITHLATIAVYADNHFKVEKNIKDNRTLTLVERIKGNLVTKEISRMLSGDRNNEAALKHAEELLKKYRSKGH